MKGISNQSELAIATETHGYKSPYLNREFDHDAAPAKQECRERVASFLMQHHDSYTLKLFSLPSVHWRFEHLISEMARGPHYYVAVEQEVGVIRKSMPWIIGRRPMWFDEGFKSHPFIGVRTDLAAVLHLNCATFLRMGRRWALTSQERGRWGSYRMWTAVWLDFTSQLCEGIELALPKLGAGCPPDVEVVPVVVTFLKGREPEHIQNKLYALQGAREDYVSALLNTSRHRTFERLETFEYASGHGSVMVTVMGLLRRKDKLDPPTDFDC